MTEQAATYVSATSDDRVVNNLMRHQYRKLSEAEKQQMQTIKDFGLAFVEKLHQIGGTTDQLDGADPTNARQASRELAVAQTKIEEACMWAVKHVTR